ncbi:MAG: 16S rRNA (uracil(1498)-N(3))-methyltransferase [Rickettsiales bacterium]|jgi:16S rRNA (uracil1498-N3)-methyltransferase|nr:16S rRNA (uracil(1498)-N(3))-methyltransferase [Rickettsiales bacterium]
MKNIPRIYVDEKIEIGKHISISKETLHYLQKVMRTDNCIIFNNGEEFEANLIPNPSFLIPVSPTGRIDPSNNLALAFAPVKKTDDMLNMATQMGVAKLQPVITARTVARHINWKRIEKIIIEAAEQSGRNSVPELLPPIEFADLDKANLIFADERAARGREFEKPPAVATVILIGPEGGFSDAEFDALDAAGAIGMSLGKTILRAEVAAVAALARTLK